MYTALALALALTSGQTWEHWDAGAAATPAGGSVALAYDGSRCETLMFGGTQTWSFDGSEWTQRATTGPESRRETAMVYMESRQRVLLFGGYTVRNQCTYPLNDTWEWDGTSWTQVGTTGPQPPARHGMVLTYDAARDVVVLYGGIAINASCLASPLTDAWEWDGVVWTQVSSGGSPRFQGAATYDTSRGVLVQGGWSSSGSAYTDTAVYDGGTWEEVSASGPPRVSHAMAFDSRRGTPVMFGGRYDNGMDDKTWELQGSTWMEVPQVGALPSRRRYHGMAYDSLRERVVLFGGETGAGVALADTWFYGTGSATTRACGEEEVDGGVSSDAGQSLTDAGEMTNDAGEMTNDAGEMTNDAGLSDAGQSLNDAGPLPFGEPGIIPDAPATGCGCGTSSGSAAALALLAFLLLRFRPRRCSVR